MKTNIFKTLLWIPLVICGLTLSACGGDDEEEGGGGEVNLLARHLKVKNVSAHYIGDRVIVDFQLENKSNKNINDLSLIAEANDDNSVNYWTINGGGAISAGEGQEWHSTIDNFTIAAHETRDMRICCVGTGLSVGVKRLTIKLSGASVQMGINFSGNYNYWHSISFTTNVADNRSTRNTIWTNDDHMSYGKPTIGRSGDDLYLSFTVTNNTGIDLPDTQLNINYYVDNGNGKNFNGYLAIDDAKEAHSSLNITINAGETRRLTVLVPDFYKSPARCVNADIYMSSKYYNFANSKIFLVSIEL